LQLIANKILRIYPWAVYWESPSDFDAVYISIMVKSKFWFDFRFGNFLMSCSIDILSSLLGWPSSIYWWGREQRKLLCQLRRSAVLAQDLLPSSQLFWLLASAGSTILVQQCSALSDLPQLLRLTLCNCFCMN